MPKHIKREKLAMDFATGIAEGVTRAVSSGVKVLGKFNKTITLLVYFQTNPPEPFQVTVLFEKGIPTFGVYITRARGPKRLASVPYHRIQTD